MKDLVIFETQVHNVVIFPNYLARNSCKGPGMVFLSRNWKCFFIANFLGQTFRSSFCDVRPSPVERTIKRFAVNSLFLEIGGKIKCGELLFLRL